MSQAELSYFVADQAQRIGMSARVLRQAAVRVRPDRRRGYRGASRQGRGLAGGAGHGDGRGRQPVDVKAEVEALNADVDQMLAAQAAAAEAAAAVEDADEEADEIDEIDEITDEAETRSSDSRTRTRTTTRPDGRDRTPTTLATARCHRPLALPDIGGKTRHAPHRIAQPRAPVANSGVHRTLSLRRGVNVQSTTPEVIGAGDHVTQPLSDALVARTATPDAPVMPGTCCSSGCCGTASSSSGSRWTTTSPTGSAPRFCCCPPRTDRRDI